MVNNNYPQITSVTSEALQAQIRNLLPSQEGFGTDLMAQNVIVPIIDLTRAAEGSSTPEILQTALAFGSQTSFAVAGTTSTLVNNSGFYRVIGTCMNNVFNVAHVSQFSISDGLSSKIIWSFNGSAGNTDFVSESYDFVVFLRAGDSLTATTTTSVFILAGSTRQIADVNGNLVQPAGFNPQ